MSGKYIIFTIFICACATEVIAGHARFHHPIGNVHNHPYGKYKAEGKEIENDVDELDSDVQKRDGNKAVKTPDTVLSVQYDRGFIKELYLSQGAGGSQDFTTWGPSVTEKTQICEDLCQAGLGGDPCGFSCPDRVPVFIKDEVRTGVTNAMKSKWTTRTTSSNESETEDDSVGNPRSDVCPVLCEYGLGKPLCGCHQLTFQDSVSWASICDSFCSSSAGSYQVDGCPECKVIADGDKVDTIKPRSSSEIWIQYCREQCRTGNGGAACNCDKIPFSLKV